jgi:hypothetical protein
MLLSGGFTTGYLLVAPPALQSEVNRFAAMPIAYHQT